MEGMIEAIEWIVMIYKILYMLKKGKYIVIYFPFFFFEII